MKNSEVVKRWKQSVALAHECANATEGGFPDTSVITQIACSIFAMNLASGSSNVNKFAGQDAGQESSLRSAYETSRSVRPSITDR